MPEKHYSVTHLDNEDYAVLMFLAKKYQSSGTLSVSADDEEISANLPGIPKRKIREAFRHLTGAAVLVKETGEGIECRSMMSAVVKSETSLETNKETGQESISFRAELFDGITPFLSGLASLSGCKELIIK